MYSICVIASNERNFFPEGNIGSLFLDAGHTMEAFLSTRTHKSLHWY